MTRATTTAHDLALKHGACTHPQCTNERRQTFHMNPTACPYQPSPRPPQAAA